MPFVLCHRGTREIYSCRLINIYDFPYYGVKSWENREEAENEYVSFLLEQGEDDFAQWCVVELDEKKVKLCNVKLNNDPRRRVFLEESGAISVKKKDD